MDTIGSRIAAFREARQLKQVDVFRATGIKQQTLSSVESGTEPKSGIVAALLAAYPDLSPDWLLTGSGPMLRDGRALSPTAAPPTSPASPARPAPLQTQPGQVDFVNKYITRLENDLAAAAERELYYQARLQELLGKPSGNLSYAAEPTEVHTMAAAPIGPRFDRCVLRAMYADVVAGQVTPLRQAV
ncbi:helix-turn-helix domain-containing protein [Hymenobacter lapidiphilus]|uniref:Helix-turn-helix transcriptional regulator n=1 Tax=Hymenobacter lapidiphilus TaxID=2608003 RepID=A0A7Y7PRY1_9BACT|nr:helix-turn-helix transcriptional regulator [Hymenobacter lapidiphilus]NVO32933.1 helix-turn-helix transcriptional regulator [Hymenobacter lapidiphilus]